MSTKTGERKPLTAWSRVYGTVYAIRCQRVKAHWYSRSTTMAYVGMTARDWLERVREHLYGGGAYHQEPKPWADLVFALGYDGMAKTRAAQLREIRKMARDGVVFAPYRKHCRYGWLKVRESWAISRHRPAFNVAENMGNPRHIPKWRQESDRTKRDTALTNRHANAVMGVRRGTDGGVEYYGHGWQNGDGGDDEQEAQRRAEVA